MADLGPKYQILMVNPVLSMTVRPQHAREHRGHASEPLTMFNVLMAIIIWPQ